MPSLLGDSTSCASSGEWTNASASTVWTDYVWTEWATNATACTTNATTVIWTTWAGENATWVQPADAAYAPVVETDIQKQAREARELARAQARERARAILDQHLDEEQRAQLARDAFFVVRGSKGQEYRVRRGRVGNVDLLKDGAPVERLCAHPRINCPDEDTMLAQKLALETDEEAFYRVANKTRIAA